MDNNHDTLVKIEVPERDLKKIFSDAAAYLGKDNTKNVKIWLKETICDFKTKYNSNARHTYAGTKYVILKSEMINFVDNAVKMLVDKFCFDLAKKGFCEMGLDADGEVTFWKK